MADRRWQQSNIRSVPAGRRFAEEDAADEDEIRAEQKRVRRTRRRAILAVLLFVLLGAAVILLLRRYASYTTYSVEWQKDVSQGSLVGYEPDAMIVTLADNDTISYTLPGKIQSYMAAGKAVIAAANGETRTVIEDSGCGMCAPAEDEKAFAAIADEMAASNERLLMGERSGKYYNEHFTKKEHVDLIENMLGSIRENR